MAWLYFSKEEQKQSEDTLKKQEKKTKMECLHSHSRHRIKGNLYHFKAAGVKAVAPSDDGQPTGSYRINMASAAVITSTVH